MGHKIDMDDACLSTTDYGSLAIQNRQLSKSDKLRKDGPQKEKSINDLTKIDADALADALRKAKATANIVGKQGYWRVANIDPKSFEEDHPGANCYATPSGSTFAVTKNGDIVAVCKHPYDDKYTGEDLMEMAVCAGGIKLDSYEHNHRFYVKCGFEPVSWCEWNDEFAPNDWNEDMDMREDIIFYHYVGGHGENCRYATIFDFKDTVAASPDYDTAMAKRDSKLKELQNS